VSGGSRLIKVSWPFLQPQWTAVLLQTVPNYELARLGTKSFMLHTKELVGFVNDPPVGDPRTSPVCWTLVVDGKPIKIRTDECPKGDKQTAQLTTHSVLINLKGAAPEKMVLVDPDQAVFPLDVPKGAAADTQPAAGGAAAGASTAPKPLTVSQFDSVFIDLGVKSAAKVTAVEANQQALRFAPKPEDDKKIRVHLTRDLTSQPGNIDILIVEDGKPATSRLVITPCESCKKAEK
jgi:hypothetical protein